MSSGKETYYFSHDTNSKDDPKCVLLIEQLGMEGYGIFWVLIETLRDQPNYKYPVANISAIARRYNTTTEKVRAVIYGYELFVVEADVFFYSESLNRRMETYNSLKSKRSESGRLGNAKRWGVSQSNRTAITEQSQVIANKVNESKVNKIKENESESQAPCKQDAQDAEHLLRQTIDFDKLVERFNAITRGKFGNIRTPLSASRKRMVRARVAEYGKESFIIAIEKATQSAFLSGQNSKEFTATFDWIIKPSNFEKILSGNYDNKKNVYNGNNSKFNRNDPPGSASSTGYETVL